MIFTARGLFGDCVIEICAKEDTDSESANILRPLLAEKETFVVGMLLNASKSLCAGW